MNLPPLQLIDHTHFYQEGEVVIDPSAAIAPGVIVQADPQSRIVVKAGVCIGAGSVLHARNGTLSLEAGASLGAGVLIVGHGRVGSHACIGSAATLINPAIAAGQIVPPGSVAGDTSRRIEVIVEEPHLSEPRGLDEPQSWADAPQTDLSASDVTATKPLRPEESDSVEQARSPDLSESEVEDRSSDAAVDSPSVVGVQVYGQGHVRQLLEALFPHRRPLNQESDPSSETDQS